MFTEEQEIDLGDAMAERAEKSYRVIEDETLTAYLNQIGQRLIRHLPPNNLRFRFAIVDLPEANAFVLPGGRVYVTRKLVALARNEDEIAGVIGHEIGHALAHHSALYFTRVFREMLDVKELKSRRDVFDQYNRYVENIARLPKGLRRNAGGEKNQLAADQVGLFAAAAAGYDPQGLANLFDRMTENKGDTGGFFSDLFGTTKPEALRLREMLKDAAIPPACAGPLGRLRGAELSADWQWLAVSERSRGAVWNLTNGQRVFHTRGFRGGHFGDDSAFYADFPKYEKSERNIARLDLKRQDAAAGPDIKREAFVEQLGPFAFAVKPAKENGDYGENVTLEVSNVQNGRILWSRPFAGEAPQLWPDAYGQTLTLVWPVTAAPAQSVIQGDATLSQRLAAMPEREGAYLLVPLDARTGKERGRLLVETGKGAFRLRSIHSRGEWVVISDNFNRVLVYHLASGKAKGKVFGGRAVVSPESKLLAVENEAGQLMVYDLTAMEKRDRFTFSSPLSLARFGPDGKTLFVLTANQMAYVLDVGTPPR